MELLQDGCLAFFCAIGMTTVLWWIATALLDPPPKDLRRVTLQVEAWGEGDGLKEDLWALRQARHALPGVNIVILDRGLTPQGSALAQTLCQQDENRVLRTAKGDE